MPENILTFEGSNYFRQRVVLATLSGKSVKIKKIRKKADDPGVTDCEANFLCLIRTITNGSRIDISQTGTVVYYQPGILIGGEFTHDCNLQRAIGYYLECLLTLAPFCKTPIHAKLTGITNKQNDHSYDSIKYSMLPVLKRFLGTDEGLDLKLVKRGAAPLGGGELIFQCPIKPKLRPINLTTHGQIKKIRGTAWANRVPVPVTNRLVKTAKGALLKLIPDVHIYTDHLKGAAAGKSPAFGITLMAETNDDVPTLYCAELCSNPRNTESNTSEPSVPEDLATDCVKMLLDEIYRGGCVDSNVQSLVCLMMTLGEKDVSKVRTGPLSPYTMQYLRHIRDFFNVVFKVDTSQLAALNDDDESDREAVHLTCVGVGYRNVAKVTV